MRRRVCPRVLAFLPLPGLALERLPDSGRRVLDARPDHGPVERAAVVGAADDERQPGAPALVGDVLEHDLAGAKLLGGVVELVEEGRGGHAVGSAPLGHQAWEEGSICLMSR